MLFCCENLFRCAHLHWVCDLLRNLGRGESSIETLWQKKEELFCFRFMTDLFIYFHSKNFWFFFANIWRKKFIIIRVDVCNEIMVTLLELPQNSRHFFFCTFRSITNVVSSRLMSDDTWSCIMMTRSVEFNQEVIL